MLKINLLFCLYINNNHNFKLIKENISVFTAYAFCCLLAFQQKRLMIFDSSNLLLKLSASVGIKNMYPLIY